MGVSVAVALVGTFWAVARFSKKPELGEPTGFGKVLANKWYVDEFYNAVVVRPLDLLAQFLEWFDKSIVDGIVNAVGGLVQYGSRQLRLLQSGQVGGYVLLMVLGILGCSLWNYSWVEVVEVRRRCYRLPVRSCRIRGCCCIGFVAGLKNLL